jgi:predicted dehydrogenase
MIEFVCGPINSVSARTAEFHAIAGIEDNVATSFALAGGGLGTLVSVWHDVLERPSLRHVEIFCERLWCTIEGDWFGPVRWMRAGGHEGSLDGESLLGEVGRAGLADENPDGAFIRAVAGGTPAQPDFATALRAHTVVDGLYRSAAAAGAPVDVSPGPRRTPT